MSRLARTLLAAVGALVIAVGAGCSEEPAGPVTPPEASGSGSASPGASLPPVGMGCRELATQGRTLRLVNAPDRDNQLPFAGILRRGVGIWKQLAMRDSTAALAVVRSVIDLAKSLGALVVAEGIETHEQLATLRELGCDHGQGFLLGRPERSDQVLVAMRRAGARSWARKSPPAPARPAVDPEPRGAIALGA